MPSIEFPEKLAPLWQPARWKICYGGRGAGRSWGISGRLVLRAMQEKRRILCARELQNSIAESVHKVLADTIDRMQANYLWEVQRDRIVLRKSFTEEESYGAGAGPSEFFFAGIKNNVNKIRSLEGCTDAWVEEAEQVTEESWEVLKPTIRLEGLGPKRDEDSEIYVSFNPGLAKSYTYREFVVKPPKDSVVIFMNYKDNKFFPTVLRKEMEEMKERDYEKYLNVWEGFPKENLAGAVYAKELQRCRVEGRIRRVPWDRETPVDTFWDLGFRDHTSIWFAQRVAMEYRVLAFYENTGEDINHYLKYCQKMPYTLGTFWLPHDAKAKRLISKRTIEEVIRGPAGTAQRSVRVVPRQSIADGINATRMIFPSCWFDAEGCEAGLDHLRQYRFDVVEGAYSKEPIHDEHSDAADGFRTLGLALRAPPKSRGALTETLERLAAKVSSRVEGNGGHGWLRP